jgi:hypothetical protein
MRLSHLRKVVHASICLLVAAIVVVQGIRAEEQCLKDAWKAFKTEVYQDAIKFADKCIDEFRKAADRAQEEINKDDEPPTGGVSDAEKTKIFSRGLLNDVATAYFIKGRSAEHLYRKGGAKASTYKEMAEQAYKATCRYKHGRTWDPENKSFWSPCQAASDRLPLD